MPKSSSCHRERFLSNPINSNSKQTPADCMNFQWGSGRRQGKFPIDCCSFCYQKLNALFSFENIFRNYFMDVRAMRRLLYSLLLLSLSFSLSHSLCLPWSRRKLRTGNWRRTPDAIKSTSWTDKHPGGHSNCYLNDFCECLVSIITNHFQFKFSMSKKIALKISFTHPLRG